MALVLEKEKELDIDIDTLWQHVKKEPIDNDVGVILLKQNHIACNTKKKSYDIDIWGKSVKQWVCLAFDQCPIMELEYDGSSDVISIIRPYLSDKKYTAVFYADTPLLQRKSFLSILDYVQTKRLNVCKLERGYVFVTDYIKTTDRLYSTTCPNLVDNNDFMVAKDMDIIEDISQILKSRILDYHLKQGVQIVEKSSVNIDADVTIGNNVVIYPNNTISGATEIDDDVQLQSNNVIIDSRIGKNSIIKSSYIINSDIVESSIIEPFSYIDNGIIKK